MSLKDLKNEKKRCIDSLVACSTGMLLALFPLYMCARQGVRSLVLAIGFAIVIAAIYITYKIFVYRRISDQINEHNVIFDAISKKRDE